MIATVWCFFNAEVSHKMIPLNRDLKNFLRAKENNKKIAYAIIPIYYKTNIHIMLSKLLLFVYLSPSLFKRKVSILCDFLIGSKSMKSKNTGHSLKFSCAVPILSILECNK
ncbi:hypothetical protein B566_EDAN012111, partial [Ephemera danica]